MNVQFYKGIYPNQVRKQSTRKNWESNKKKRKMKSVKQLRTYRTSVLTCLIVFIWCSNFNRFLTNYDLIFVAKQTKMNSQRRALFVTIWFHVVSHNFFRNSTTETVNWTLDRIHLDNEKENRLWIHWSLDLTRQPSCLRFALWCLSYVRTFLNTFVSPSFCDQLNAR